VPPGQWVYTSQYGWVWMPYGDAYTYVPPDGAGEPSMYVYYAGYGWTWIAAPWVWGYGPWPWFGAAGPYGFGWYGYGWWRQPWRYRYVPRGPMPYGRGGGAPAPVRGGAVAPAAPAPVRGGAAAAPAPVRGGASAPRPNRSR
jgi:hypothetical protein